jgi:hypothetical protein
LIFLKEVLYPYISYLLFGSPWGPSPSHSFLMRRTSINSFSVHAQKRARLWSTTLSSLSSSCNRLFGNMHHFSICIRVVYKLFFRGDLFYDKSFFVFR